MRSEIWYALWVKPKGDGWHVEGELSKDMEALGVVYDRLWKTKRYENIKLSIAGRMPWDTL